MKSLDTMYLWFMLWVATTTLVATAFSSSPLITAWKSSNKLLLGVKSLFMLPSPPVWWEELAPPFLLVEEEDEDSLLNAMEEEEESLYNANEQQAIPAVADTSSSSTHFCFLIHGHRGMSKDLSYLQAVMERFAKKSFAPQAQNLVVHSAVCNEGKTTDGVIKGGERLVQEMLDTIRNEMKGRITNDITISVVGNSLGGIYGRYAIAKLIQEQCKPDAAGDDNSKSRGKKTWILDDKYRVHLNVFCTTATPHLGVSKHTYLPLPRSAEIGVAHAMGHTGRDLFRLNDLIKTMALSPYYLEPLAHFRKRIAYANAYGTDFPVPAQTAAFLSEQSEYPHHYKEHEDDLDDMILAILHTQPHGKQASDDDSAITDRCSAVAAARNSTMDHRDEVVRMSASLDALGWKKVFVDVRREIPLSFSWPTGVNLNFSPLFSNINILNKSSNNAADTAATANEEASSASSAACGTHREEWKRKRVVASHEVASAVSCWPPGDNRLSLPMGHNMIVAFSRTRISALLYKGGRPVVDALAQELVTDIYGWVDGAGHQGTSARGKKDDMVCLLENNTVG